MTAASRNDAAPILRVFLELIALKGIDLVTNHAGHGHKINPRNERWSPGRRRGYIHSSTVIEV
jgi:hypothetical protein